MMPNKTKDPKKTKEPKKETERSKAPTLTKEEEEMVEALRRETP